MCKNVARIYHQEMMNRLGKKTDKLTNNLLVNSGSFVSAILVLYDSSYRS